MVDHSGERGNQGQLGVQSAAIPPTERMDTDTAMSVATRVGPGFAQVGEVADYLRVSRRSVTELLCEKSVLANRAGRFGWVDIWWKLWRVRNVPPEFFESMTHPLLTNADVADMLGVHERSIRRDGDRAVSRYELPVHLDLSERIRRHHPIRIRLWSRDLLVPSWLDPVPAGRSLALAGRKRQASDVSEQVSDTTSNN